MKLKSGFMLREIAEQWVVVPIGQRVVEFNAIMTLTESGAVLWKALKEESAVTQLVQCLLQEYDVDEQTATLDVQEFLQNLMDKGMIDV